MIGGAKSPTSGAPVNSNAMADGPLIVQSDRTVLLEVAHENAAARALYERTGFTPTGRTGEMPHDPSITELEMELVLSDDTVRSWQTLGKPI